EFRRVLFRSRIHDEEVLVRERRGMIGERPERSDDHAEHTDCQRPEERSGRERDARGAAATRDMTQSKEEQREGDANAEEDRESCGWLRSEERRVGKEWRARWAAGPE